MRFAIFGENTNDSHALRAIILGLVPNLSRSDVVIVKSPPTLTREAKADALATWAEKAASALRGLEAASGKVDWILAHTDSDEPDDGAFAKKRASDLNDVGLTNVIAVVPVEAIESWWLLHPEPTESVVPSWKGALKRDAFNTDSVSDPKSELIRRTRAKQPRRPYQEGDSPGIGIAIVESGFQRAKANSPSWERFRSEVSRLAPSD